MYATDYVKPKAVAEAVEAIGEAGDGKYLAGGMTLIPTMKQRLAAPDRLIDLAGCKLGKISAKADAVAIGAMATHATVASDPGVMKTIPALARLACGIGDRQVRNRGTIGGSVANNDPAACYPAAVLALDGIVETDRRSLPAGEFFTGLFETALEEDEIVTSVTFPKPKQAAYAKFANPASRYALVGVFVAMAGNGEVRVAVTGAGADGVFRSEELEAALDKDFSPGALDGAAVDPGGLMGDIHASADYRAHLVVEMARRAVAAAQ